MFAYALHAFRTQSTLWIPALVCAAVPALVVSLAATVFAPSTVSFIVTGDIGLAARLLPGDLGSMPMSLLLLVGGLLLVLVWAAWSRVYAIAVWLSDVENGNNLAGARSATRVSWRRVALLYLRMYALLAVALAALALPVGGTAGAGLGGGALVTAGLLLIVLRTALRIVLTLAVRAAVLDDETARAAWRRGRNVGREQARDVVAAWMLLVSLGVVVWQGGRLATPALQDTALAFPHTSGYTYVREAAQLLVAIPLEALLMAVSFVVWTAAYKGADERAERPAGVGRLPVVALLGVLALVLVGNTVPTIAENRFAAAANEPLDLIEDREIAPAEARSNSSGGIEASEVPLTQYTVDAFLTGDTLEWTTTIHYTNDTGDRLADLGVHVYPAAYTRDIGDLPLATDLFAADYTRQLSDEARPAEVDLHEVRVGKRVARASLDGTALVVPLPGGLAPGSDVEVTISLEARLPRWPERFGVWGDRTLLGNWIPVVAQREDGEWRLDPYGDVGDPFFAGLANYAVNLEVEAGEQVVGSGALVSSGPTSNGRHVWQFVAEGHRDAAFAISRVWRGLERSVRGTIVRSWYPADQREFGVDNLNAAVDAVTFYDELFGSAVTEEIEVVEAGGYLGGMEYPGVVFVSSSHSPLTGLPLLPDLFEFAGFRDAQARYAIGHEVAHQWWYSSVGNDQVREPWLDEAFAEYSTRRWLIDREGSEESWTKTNLTTAAHSTAVIDRGIEDFSSNLGYSQSIYLSGSQILFDLRALMGAQEFDDLMREWFATHAGGIASVDEFVEFVRDRGGDSAARLLESYRGVER